MATKTNSIYFVCSILALFFVNTKSFLDIDDLKTANYGIDILNDPVKIGQETSGSIVQLRSKFGQQYQCSFPDQVEQDKQKEEEEKIALETGIQQLLAPFQSQGCLFKTKDWWSYEFCYGKHIRQMHLEEGKIIGEVIYLGHYESDFDWDNQTNKDQRLRGKSWQTKYHSQTYTNGSKCDLTGRGRKTEVRFYCEEGAADYISRIDEPETCAYVVSIYTSRLCPHPYLKPPAPKLAVPITCNPLLSDQQYEAYLQKKKALEEEKERLVQEAKKEAEAMVTDSSQDGTVPTGTDSDDEDFSAFDNILTPSMEKAAKDALTNQMKTLAGKSNDVDVKVSFKVVKDFSNMEQVLKEAFAEEEAAMSGTGSQVHAGGESETTDAQQGSSDTAPVELADPVETPNTDSTLKFKSREGEKEEETDEVIEEEDEELMEEFDKEVGNLKTAYKNKKDKFVNMKNKVRDSMKLQFEDIIEEAEDMLDQEIDRKAGFKQLAETLNKLIHKLDNAEKEIDNVDKELENFHKKTAAASENPDSAVKPKGPGKQSTETKGELSEEERVKVRVTKIKSGDNVKDGSDVPEDQKSQLEQTVKDGIIKAGLDTGGGKIQVKIITTGYTQEDDDTLTIFSPEETSNFQNMIVQILGGSNEALKEAERQNKLEQSYNQVWGESKNKKSKNDLDNA